MLGDDEILTVTLADSVAGLRLDRALAEADSDGTYSAHSAHPAHPASARGGAGA